jgi:uncharacterized protein (DUF305 family)
MLNHRYENRSRNSLSTWSALLLVTSLSSGFSLLGCGDDDDSSGDMTSDGGAGGTSSGPRPGGGSSGGSATASAGEAGSNASSTGGAGGAASQALATTGDRRIPYTPQSDLEFTAFFISHHQMAIDMAKEETERGASADVKAMAAKMIESQTKEVATLEAIQEQLGGDVPPPPPEDPHSMADMDRLQGASGAELDQLFLQDMIPHHAAGLAPAHRSLPYLETPELQTMVESIVHTQAAEIGEMYEMLHQLGAEGAGDDAAPPKAGRADFGLVGDRRVPLTPEDDVEFIDFFVPHHAMAVEMAEHEIAHGQDAAVIAMAKMMRDAQTAEIELMQSKRLELAGSADPTPMPEDPHATSEMAAMMKMTGAKLDMMFLEEMLVHHSSALPTSHRAKPHVSDQELQDLADSMFGDQAKEIGELEAMLKK